MSLGITPDTMYGKKMAFDTRIVYTVYYTQIPWEKRLQGSDLEPIPDICINGFRDPKFDEVKCLPVFLNHMVVSAATSDITEELRRLKGDVSDETYYAVELYDVTHLDDGKLNVRVIDDGYPTAQGRRVSAHQASLTEMGDDVIPGSEKLSFSMTVSSTLTLTRYYHRHIPPKEVEIKGILIQYHGWADTCKSWEEYSKTTAIADKYGLILITACGSDNGGMMVESLLCHKVIQKAVSVNAVLALNPGLQGSFKTCNKLYNNASFGPIPPVPRVASIHCLDDQFVPYNGSILSKNTTSYFSADLFPRTNRDMRLWARRIGCDKKETTRTRINDWTRLKEWKCPAEERVVSIKRFNCSHYGSAHAVVRTFDFDPANWAVRFFLGEV
ncbi:hypothetical protein FOZ63_032043 [Perkinsus olseni]|uniref:Uncharacterized protein n=1 Tax=Perkinsus olseni TaxID=32597 RepID=A0A7J6NSP8_PEROL|nr:hypothetical protein FOZ62_027994 [Perkinsus olseni]KAF4686557.1 hypothetical protein FOZ60_005064 [Perkinsus olseni]KAF4708503.1 hypothetical protein FOZ63_032043 [Perkinsus olseni]